MYYVFIKKEKFGPCSLEQIKSMNLSHETLIWKEGLDNWVKAIELEELKNTFIKSPPPLPLEVHKNIKRDVFLKIFIYNFLIGIILTIIFNWIAYFGIITDNSQRSYSQNDEWQLFSKMLPASFLVSQSIMLLISLVKIYKVSNKYISELEPIKKYKIQLMLIYIFILTFLSVIKIYPL